MLSCELLQIICKRNNFNSTQTYFSLYLLLLSQIIDHKPTRLAAEQVQGLGIALSISRKARNAYINGLLFIIKYSILFYRQFIDTKRDNQLKIKCWQVSNLEQLKTRNILSIHFGIIKSRDFQVKTGKYPFWDT